MKSFLVLMALLLTVSLPARAEGELISFASVIDLGPVAIAEARRVLLADIEDWKDDRTTIGGRRILACMLAGIPGGIGQVLGGLTMPVARDAIFSARLIERFNKNTHGPAAPLHLPLSELAAKVPFTDTERKVLESLMGRETLDSTDRLRLAIDIQSFLMKVSVRLYERAIREQLSASRSFRSILSPGQATCSAYTLQADRDTQLIKAATRVLGLYSLLERELRD